MLIIAIGAFITSCTDNTFNDGNSNFENASVRLTLCLPCGDIASTRAGGTDASTGTNDGEEYERQLTANDLHLLIFEKDQLKEEVTNLQLLGTEGSANRILYGITSKTYDENVDIVVLANLKGCEVSFDSNSYIGKSKEEIYQSLKYSFDKFEKENGIPMWGTLSLPQIKSSVTADINLYRAVAKIGITVNEGNGLDNFTLTSVRAYFSNTEGYCTPINVTAKELENQEILYPSVPSTSEQRDITSPLSFEGLSGNDFKNQLYISEAANKTLGEGKKAVCLVVGGKYTGEGLVGAETECYYRIDFKDDLESSNKNDPKAYDLVRNHLYQFDITKVSNPGTPTPEEALDNVVVGMDVKITDWADAPMRGIPDQYTLTTDKSRVTFDKDGNKTEDITVWTDYTDGWEIEQLETYDWFKLQKSGDKVLVTVDKANGGIAKTGIFYITIGNETVGMLRKQIIVEQEQPTSSNCYIVGDGEHELIVTIKGNGTKGLLVDGEVTLEKNASLTPDHISIIWETKRGLVTLKQSPTSGSFVSQNAAYNTETGTITYKVNSSGATISNGKDGKSYTGGNALIGAYDSKGQVIWSWHIWVCPDMIDTNGNIKDTYVEDWTPTTGYYVLDRYLGALSNKPGVASLGLLYQWGRKDPFIGAKAISEETYGSDRWGNITPALGQIETYVYDNNQKWGINNKGTNIQDAIHYPTKLLKNGLSEVMAQDGATNKNIKMGAYLWGTSKGLLDEKNLGSKTIYDPCPEGYRIPPVDAFVFSTNKAKEWNNATRKWSNEGWKINDGFWGTQLYSKSSQTDNWNENLTYVPHYVNKAYDGKPKVDFTNNTSGQRYLNNLNGSYISDAYYYGYYINYKKAEDWGDRPDVEEYDSQDKENGAHLTSSQGVTWFPLGGVYDPNDSYYSKGDYAQRSESFMFTKVQNYHSLTVNSIVWTNSSVVALNGGVRPAAMFLHGASPRTTGDGRHIHALNATDYYAEKQFAGSVRCVRDVKKDFSESNKISQSISLSPTVGSKTTIKIYSVNDTWRVIDPGADWFVITPDKGNPNKGTGEDITFKVLKAYSDHSDKKATVKILFESETKPREIIVTQTSR